MRSNASMASLFFRILTPILNLTVLGEGRMFCPKCGTLAQDDDQYCANCGGKLPDSIIESQSTDNAVTTPTNKSPLTKVQGRIYPGMFVRFCAALIDGFVVLIFMAGMFFLQMQAHYNGFYRLNDNYFAEILFLAGSITLTLLYFMIFECLPMQATLGKYILGMKVIAIGEKRLYPGRALLRNLVKLLSWATFGIGFLVAGFNANRQALHDKASGCLVVRRKAGEQEIVATTTSMHKVSFGLMPSVLLSLAVTIALGLGFNYVYQGVFLDPSAYEDPKVAGGHGSNKSK